MKTPAFNGTIARTAIQCVYPATGETGSFLFTGDNHRDADAICSPCFPDLVPLFAWARSNHFEAVGYDYVYQGEGSHGQGVENAVLSKHSNVI